MVKCAILSVVRHSKNWHNFGTLLEKKTKCAKKIGFYHFWGKIVPTKISLIQRVIKQAFFAFLFCISGQNMV